MSSFVNNLQKQKLLYQQLKYNIIPVVYQIIYNISLYSNSL
jgi:hypothetical protein